MIDKASSKRFEGWPLDSLSIKTANILLMEVLKKAKKIS